eukprot:360512-Chlamydomonas_euryale.AAC.3
MPHAEVVSGTRATCCDHKRYASNISASQRRPALASMASAEGRMPFRNQHVWQDAAREGKVYVEI